MQFLIGCIRSRYSAILLGLAFLSFSTLLPLGRWQIRDSDLTLELGDGIYKCRLVPTEHRVGRSRLIVEKLDSGEVIIDYEKPFAHAQNVYFFDLTGDYEPEIVTVWAAGLAYSVAVFTIKPSPGLILEKGFRHLVSFDQEYTPPYRRTLRIESGSSNFSDVTAETYAWSEETKMLEKVAEEAIERK